MSSKFEQKGPAQPKGPERQEQPSTGSQDKSAKSQPKDDDMPGADGPLSAGANEDTYD